ncbi:hypothetical protein CPU09_14030 [Mammaliicoccus sciuri]|uniref:hypothetical protein n=1 Tax=Mammaliicoccus sciuri TaxID=1296 RepID=UPI000BBE683D|nr:hypothetical protein [Mammaliicoccus sciuri]PCM39997.1 hypothetical protein CPU09_14030 [Mammaliicoccus sciuri]
MYDYRNCQNRNVLCLDLKSFFASVSCAESNRIEAPLLKSKGKMLKDYKKGEVTKESMIQKHGFNAYILEDVLKNI